MHVKRVLYLRFACLMAAWFVGAASAVEPLPSGDAGIAARYLGDEGIASDPRVIFSDGFESYGSASELTKRWDEVFQIRNYRITTANGSVFSGLQALEIAVPAGTTEVANELRKRMIPALDTVYLRAYTMWHPENDVVGSSHNGLHVSASYCCAGVPANGTNKFTVSSDVHRLDASVPNPGETTVYIYHPEQRSQWGDYWYPDGRVIPFDSIRGDFGPDFVPRPDFVPELGRWYSWEMMVKANTPGLRDGRIAIWVDGNLIADWQNVRLRDASALRIDLISIDMHANAPRSVPLRKYYDNLVVATSYIGPVFAGDTSKPLPPTNVRVSSVGPSY